MNRRKSFVLIAMVALLLTFTVSGTIAWLAASTDELVNTFTPGKIDTEIDEPGWDDKTKGTVQVTNTASTISVYVRVAVAANWVKGGVIVQPWSGTIDHDETYWTYNEDDGFYYYNTILPAGDTTENLLANPITYTSEEVPVEDAKLVITIIHQSIQAEGMGATGPVDAFEKAKDSVTTTTTTN